jgi:hypothetical protein
MKNSVVVLLLRKIVRKRFLKWLFLARSICLYEEEVAEGERK